VAHSTASESLRVVLDTNVWISGIFFSRGTPAQLLREWRDGRFEVVITSATLEELAAVLYRKTAQFDAPQQLAAEWLEFVRAYAIHVKVDSRLEGSVRDPKDDMILEAAVSGKVDYLVTGDQDLLVLGKFANLQIVTPRQFLEWLQNQSVGQ